MIKAIQMAKENEIATINRIRKQTNKQNKQTTKQTKTENEWPNIVGS